VSIGHTDRMPKALKRAALVSAAVLAGSLILVPIPGSADPDPAGDDSSSGSGKLTLSEARDKVDALNHQAEVAAEAMNTVKVQLKAAKQHLGALESDVQRQRDRVDALREQVIGRAMSSYQNGGGLSASTSFLVASDPQSFLTGLADDAVVDNQQAGLLSQLTQQQKQLSLQEGQAKSELDAIADDKTQLAKHKAELDEKADAAQAVLDDLEQKQLERLMEMQASNSTTTLPPTRGSGDRVNTNDIPASDRAQVAVDTALAQIGDPYVYGAAGPDSFDCSGLTMYAWAAAGVQLSHASSVQPTQGTPVSLSELMPGDLIFYYSPISHVGMYIGHGQIVHAPHPGTVVSITSMYEMPIATAVRVG
jgi:cell wall-associated NlpC family hydrolase